jgi:hypothetical protein
MLPEANLTKFQWCARFFSETIRLLCVTRRNFKNETQGALYVTFHQHNLVQYYRRNPVRYYTMASALAWTEPRISDLYDGIKESIKRTR